MHRQDIACSINWTCLLCLLLFTLFIALYFAGTYILYGIIILSSPGYNTTTGCPNDKPKCWMNHNRMVCYENHMEYCYMLGCPTAMGFVIGIGVLLYIIYCSCKCLCTKKITNESQKNDDELIYIAADTLSPGPLILKNVI